MAFLCSDVLALPIFKQEESNLPPETENKILPFQYVLCAPTSPAIKLHDETLTYLNQGQYQDPRDATANPAGSKRFAMGFKTGKFLLPLVLLYIIEDPNNEN